MLVRSGLMLVFLDFEASSLSKQSYPIEVAWMFEDGRSEAHLIRPLPEWTDWDDEAEAIHGISCATLLRDGTDPAHVAARMVETLGGHDLLASAPSWDGKWLSVLLRGGGLPRHALRLRDSDDVHADAASAILADAVPPDRLRATVDELLARAEPRAAGLPPAHRALADAEEERQRWIQVRAAAIRLAAELRAQ